MTLNKDLNVYSIEKLIYMHDKARKENSWKLVEIIRDFLDTKGVYIMNTSDNQQIYYVKDISRDIIDRNMNFISSFNSWLYSQLKIMIQKDEKNYHY